MNMFAKFDENPAMILQDIKEIKRYGRTHAHTDNLKTVYPPQSLRGGGGLIIFLPINLNVFRVVKRTVTLRRFFRVPTTYVLDEK